MTSEPLTERDFWDLVALVDPDADDGTAAGSEAALDRLTAALRKRPAQDAEAFMWGVTRRAGQLLRRADAVLPDHLAVGGDSGRIQALSVVLGGERFYSAALVDPTVVHSTFVSVAEGVPVACARLYEELTGVALDIPEGDEDPADLAPLVDVEEGWISVRPAHAQVPEPVGYWPAAEQLAETLRHDVAWQRWWAQTGAPPALIYVNFDTAQSLREWTGATVEGEVRLGQVRVRRYRDRVEASIYSPSVGSEGSQVEVRAWVRQDLGAAFAALAGRCGAGAPLDLP